MNPLQQVLIEKAGQEQGWERSLDGPVDAVVLGSARHKARISIAQTDISRWEVRLAEGLLAEELGRSFTHVGGQHSTFVASSRDELSALLRRAAELAQSLPNQAELTYAVRLKDALAELGPMTTEVERIVKQRVGQDTFRQALMDYWGGACAVTGIALPPILRGSHAKPWADCASDAERLDVYNGLLLTANLDSLFDQGLITFKDDGQAIFGSELTPALQDTLGLPPRMRLRWISSQHRKYLNWHRAHVYDKRRNGTRTDDVVTLP